MPWSRRSSADATRSRKTRPHGVPFAMDAVAAGILANPVSRRDTVTPHHIWLIIGNQSIVGSPPTGAHDSVSDGPAWDEVASGPPPDSRQPVRAATSRIETAAGRLLEATTNRTEPYNMKEIVAAAWSRPFARARGGKGTAPRPPPAPASANTGPAAPASSAPPVGLGRAQEPGLSRRPRACPRCGLAEPVALARRAPGQQPNHRAANGAK